jgi:hypothetical protein
MKNFFLLMSAVFGLSASAAMPFTYSGAKIQAIFAEPKVWKVVGGAVESIVLKGYSGNTTKYQITTTESNPIKDPAGGTIGWMQQPCLLTVEVTGVGDPMAPKWEVSKIDDSTCPVNR